MTAFSPTMAVRWPEATQASWLRMIHASQSAAGAWRNQRAEPNQMSRRRMIILADVRALGSARFGADGFGRFLYSRPAAFGGSTITAALAADDGPEAVYAYLRDLR